MNTLRDYVSSVRAAFRLVSSDDIISDRYIANEILNVNRQFVMQQIDKRVGINSPTLFTMLKCIPLTEVPLSECCEYDGECTVARSVKRIPTIVSGKQTLVVQGVWDLERKYKFKETNPNRYSNSLKMGLTKSSNYFWVMDGYLYVSNPNIEVVSISAFFHDLVDPDTYSCSSVSSCPTNPLDLEIKTLSKLMNPVINEVYQKILATYKQSKEDPQDNDINETV